MPEALEALRRQTRDWRDCPAEMRMPVASRTTWDGTHNRDRSRAWLRSRVNSIEGGTSEIQLEILAERVLDLPGS